ncbi:T9SS type A sorting domain-containing protein [candidate division KSB1 bacterium]|nr:T9SS type A sorting domain-containing protein [candidate division KSB1 bacterium]
MKRITILLVSLLAYTALYAQDIPREGLVGYWKMDEGEGLVAGDSSGYGAHGELFGVADWVDGYMGKALEFDGVDGHVFCGIGDGQFDLEYEVTLSVWVNQWDMGNGEHNPWLGKGDHSYCIKHQNVNQYEFFVYTTDWTSAHAPLDSSHLFSWHHFVGTYDMEALKLYIDGVPVDTVLHDQPIAYSEFPVSIAWNSDDAATGRYFAGQLDEAMIYNVALTEEQVLQLYNIKSEVMEQRTLANKFRLQQNYPNPFNPLTRISYTIPANLPVILKLYDIRGQEVQTLVNEQQRIGTHTVTFDASGLPSGLYFYKLEAGDLLAEMKKMMLIR